MYAALCCILHSLMAALITFCCRLAGHQLTRCYFISSTFFIRHSYLTAAKPPRHYNVLDLSIINILLLTAVSHLVSEIVVKFFLCQQHQLDHMQTICASLQTDNHTNTSSLNSYRSDALPDAQPTLHAHIMHA